MRSTLREPDGVLCLFIVPLVVGEWRSPPFVLDLKLILCISYSCTEVVQLDNFTVNSSSAPIANSSLLLAHPPSLTGSVLHTVGYTLS